MKFESFKQVIKDLKESHEVASMLYDFIRPEVFESHNRLIVNLLDEIYGEYITSYILYEWLSGNKSPVVYTGNDGVQVTYPVKTVYDLWKVMERLKEPGVKMKKAEIPSETVFWTPSSQTVDKQEKL